MNSDIENDEKERLIKKIRIEKGEDIGAIMVSPNQTQEGEYKVEEKGDDDDEGSDNEDEGGEEGSDNEDEGGEEGSDDDDEGGEEGGEEGGDDDDKPTKKKKKMIKN